MEGTFIEIRSRRGTFARAGVNHGEGWKRHPISRFTPEEVEALEGEEMLQVRIIGPPPGPDAMTEEQSAAVVEGMNAAMKAAYEAGKGAPGDDPEAVGLAAEEAFAALLETVRGYLNDAAKRGQEAGAGNAPEPAEGAPSEPASGEKAKGKRKPAAPKEAPSEPASNGKVKDKKNKPSK